METTQGNTASICKQGEDKKRQRGGRENRQICSLIAVAIGCYVRQAKCRWVHWMLGCAGTKRDIASALSTLDKLRHDQAAQGPLLIPIRLHQLHFILLHGFTSSH